MTEHWQIFAALVALVAGWSLIIMAALRVMFSKLIKTNEDKICKTQETLSDLEREFLNLKADLPLFYVRREDFIRFDVVINSKLDKLRDLVVEALQGKSNSRKKEEEG